MFLFSLFFTFQTHADSSYATQKERFDFCVAPIGQITFFLQLYFQYCICANVYGHIRFQAIYIHKANLLHKLFLDDNNVNV